MEPLQIIQGTNPLLILVFISALYFIVVALRRETGTTLLALLSLLLLALLLLPQGQALQERMNDLPRGSERWRCWSKSFSSGDFISTEKIEESKYCDYSGLELFPEDS